MREVQGSRFSHTYMERFWPKTANNRDLNYPMKGIRYPYGDLDDVIDLLYRDPYTRQAYFPIFFPEDTGAVHGGRTPCTLGYHFMMRENRLNMFYPIRSCDIMRHLRDDIYLACRLLLWVLNQLDTKEHEESSSNSLWTNVSPGNLMMQIYSLHMFIADKEILEYRRSLK